MATPACKENPPVRAAPFGSPSRPCSRGATVCSVNSFCPALGITRASDYRKLNPGSPSGRGVGFELWLQDHAGCTTLRTRAVLIATGCYEKPLAFPGWTVPGVMGAGAIQGFLKSQQFVPGERFVLAGSHPLQLVVADQLLGAGANVAAVVFTQHPWQVRKLLRNPLALLGNTRALMESMKILWRLSRAGVALKFGKTIVRAEGKSLQRVMIAALQRDGSIERSSVEILDCDRLGICHGFLASSELARQAGVHTIWREYDGGWLAGHDEWFESSLRGLFVAGEITGVAGADAALEKGRIAGIGVLRALGRIELDKAERLAKPPRRRLRRIERFAQALSRLARPPQQLASETMTHDALLCRCESISCGEFRQRLEAHPHIASADAAKLLTRVGMGICQGRLCGDNAARMIADLRGIDRADVGLFQAQIPVKPVRLDLLSGSFSPADDSG